MAYTGKQFLDLDGLERYDQKIKEYIDNGDLKSIKKVLKSSDGILHFYTDANATLESTPVFSVPIGGGTSEDLSTLATEDKSSLVGAINETYSLYQSFTPIPNEDIENLY